MNSPPRGEQAEQHSVRVPNFDSLAGIYRWMEWFSFGPLLWWCRCAFLDALQSSRRALILGDGDGRFTARLLATNSAVRVDAVDASPAMLRQLLRGAGANGSRVRTHSADIRTWQPPARDYDLIITHFFLDCLSTTEVASLAQRLRSYTRLGATWVVSEFDVPRNWMGPLIARPLIAGLYWAFGVLTGLGIRALPDHHKALSEAGFFLQRKQNLLGGLLVSELWQRDL